MRKTVQDVMTKTVVVVGEGAPFKEIVGLMDEFRVSALPVVDAGRHVKGIVSEADLLLKEERPEKREFLPSRRRRLDRDKAEGLVASQLMTRPAITIGPDASIGEAARLLHREGIKRLPVVDGEGKLMGIVSRADLLRVFLRDDEEIRREVTQDVIGRTLWIDPHEISVTVHDGVVTLKGVAEQRSLIPIIVDLVKQVDGVVGVECQLGFDVDDRIYHHPGVITPWYVPPAYTRSGHW